MSLQQTIKKTIEFEGLGLHSGKPIRMILHPAAPDTGVVFFRRDLDRSPGIPALVTHVVNTQLATTIGRDKATVSTVEHVLCALAALEIDNVKIEIDGPEVPILDGSSLPFVDKILSIGIDSQLGSRTVLRVKKKVEVKIADKWAFAEPSPRLEIHGSIEWDHPAIGYQEYRYIQGQTEVRELALARTFCLFRDVEAMKRAGLAKGGSLENAVVLDDTSVLNPEGLRAPNELVRHKVLDALGDFKLAGFTIEAKIRLHRAGHDLHNQLLKAILKDPSNYEIVGKKMPEKAARGVPAAAAESEIELPSIAAMVRSWAASF